MAISAEAESNKSKERKPKQRARRSSSKIEFMGYQEKARYGRVETSLAACARR